MSKKARKAIIYALFGLFFILGCATLFYAQGYRFDLDTFRIKKVGAIYIRTLPKTAEVLLDGKTVERGSQLFTQGTLIQSLFPKTYKLTAKASGYKKWQRIVSVQPTLVSEILAILLPEKYSEIQNYEPLFFSSLPNSVAIKNSSGIYLLNTKVPGKEIADISKSGDQIITKDGTNYYLADVSSEGILSKSQKLITSRNNIIFDIEPGQFLSISSSGVYTFALGGKPASIWKASLGQTIAKVSVSRSFYAWTIYDLKKDSSDLWLYDKFSSAAKKIGDSLPGKNMALGFSQKNQLALLQKNGDFYIYNIGTEEFQKMSSGVKQYSFSDDGVNLGILEQNSLELYSNGGADYTRVNLASFGEIQSFKWYKDKLHLLVQFPDHLGLLDLESLDPQSVEWVADGTQNSYGTEANALYFVKDGELLRLDFPE